MLYVESALLTCPDTLLWEKGDIQRQEFSTLKKIQHYASNFFLLTASLIYLPFAAALSLASRAISYFRPAAPTPELTHVANQVLGDVLPDHFGFADSLFQSSGVGTSFSPTTLAGRSNWEKWLDPAHIEGTDNYREFFVEILQDPKPFIAILKEMGVSAYRFSLEWSVIEPEAGVRDPKAMDLYRNFIRELKNEGIEPWVTLHHFVLPDWIAGADRKDFEDPARVDLFVNHSLAMMEEFPEITYWMTFNEPGVYAFQTRVRGVYPPGVQGDLGASARVLRNLLVAHCKIYKAAKEKFGDSVQVGLTHQWLNFEPLEGNPLESLICFFLSKMTHYCVYNFFKTGKFAYEMPLQANVHFDVPNEEFEKNNGFLDFIGVQFYGYPRLKAGFNGGEEYPGYDIKNIPLWKTGLTFGSTCPKGGKAMSFGPLFYPESLQSCLTEAAALKKPIAITETGCDAKIQKWGAKEFVIDNETQKEYFEKITPILGRFKEQLIGFFTWTLYRGQLEWDRGDAPALGVVKLIKDEKGTITGKEMFPAAKLLQEAFLKAQKEIAKQRPKVA